MSIEERLEKEMGKIGKAFQNMNDKNENQIIITSTKKKQNNLGKEQQDKTHDS